jgi:hypothetical protein
VSVRFALEPVASWRLKGAKDAETGIVRDGLFAEELATVRLPEKVPVVDDDTPLTIAQVWFGESAWVVQFEVWLTPCDCWIEDMYSGTPPVFVTVTVWLELVVLTAVPKFKEEGETCICPLAAGVALSVIVGLPVKSP